MSTSQKVTIRVIDETGTSAEVTVMVPAGTSDDDAVKIAGIAAGAQTQVVGRVDLVDNARVREQLAAEEQARTARRATDAALAAGVARSRVSADADSM